VTARESPPTYAGYGLEVTGLPPGWLPSAPGPARRTLAWSAAWGAVEGTVRSWAAGDGRSLRIGWAGYGDYRITMGPAPRVRAYGPVGAEELARGFLLSVLPLALPLLDLEPLHGAAVAVHGGALLLLGPSGSGKSSLAAALANVGHGFLADDACAVDDDGVLWPGPRLLGCRIGSAGHPVVGTYDGKMVLVPRTYNPSPRPAGWAVVLVPKPGARLKVRPVARREAVTLLLRHVRAPRLLASDRRRRQLRVVSRLAERPVAVLTYEPGVHGPAQVGAAAAAYVTSPTGAPLRAWTT
jgi:hypothetical protein